MLEAIECLKSWLKIADQEAVILKDLITLLQEDTQSNIQRDRGPRSSSDSEIVALWEVG